MYSFDVYDTIVTRKVMHPQAIFTVMQHKLLEGQKEWGIPFRDIFDFKTMRINAEKQARRESDNEITLDSIYSVMARDYNIKPLEIDKLKKLEIQCELENTIVCSETVKRVTELIDSGEHVILISDMYMPRQFFNMLFDKVCPFLNTLKLYLSSEIGLTKGSGLLYPFIKEKEALQQYSTWIHEGDNIFSDVNIPRIFGIKTVLHKIEVNQEALLRVCSLQTEQELVKEYLQGILKEKKVSEQEPAYIIGYGFVGFVLYSYANWVISQSVEQGIQQLYFIARDGYILKKIADIILKINDIKTIETHYLYGSRKAWRVNDTDKREKLLQYLQQEISGNDTFALVDTQGTGVSIDYLAHIYGSKLKVFYYTLLEGTDDKHIDASAFSPYAGNEIIEVLCRAPHGSVIGYEEQNGNIIPIMDAFDLAIWQQAKLDEYMEGVLDFATEFASINKLCNNSLPLKSLAEEILKYCARTPDFTLANFIGDIPHDTNNESESYKYAPLIRQPDIYRIEVERTTQSLTEYYHGVELEYSYKRLRENEKEIIKKYKKQYLSEKPVKKQSTKKIIIYGYGVYGKELFHRLYKHPDIEVIAVVDANYQNYGNEEIHIFPIETIMKCQYDFVVISLYSEKLVRKIREMLVKAGVKADKILLSEDIYNCM